MNPSRGVTVGENFGDVVFGKFRARMICAAGRCPMPFLICGVFSRGCPSKVTWVHTPEMPIAATVGRLVVWWGLPMRQPADKAMRSDVATIGKRFAIAMFGAGIGPMDAIVRGDIQHRDREIECGSLRKTATAWVAIAPQAIAVPITQPERPSRVFAAEWD